MLIKYRFVNGETSEVDVTDELGAVLLDLDRLEYNNDQTETRRHASLEAMDYEGELFIDPNTDVVALIERDFSIATVRRVMDKLLPQERDLLHQIFFEGITAAEIARREDVNKSSIHKRLQRIYGQMKKILN